MRVEQALFTSAATRRHRGYHLISRSPDIDDRIASELTLWGPTHGALASDDIDAESINFFPLSGDYFAISRTVYGGPEYSGRGALQVVTRYLVLSQEQFELYDCNPLSVIRTAMVLGHLRLSDDDNKATRPIDLPDEPLNAALPPRRDTSNHQALAVRVRDASQSGQPVVISGADDPPLIVEAIFSNESPESRTRLSFTTGLKPSPHRPFRIHFVDQKMAAAGNQFRSQNLTCVNV